MDKTKNNYDSRVQIKMEPGNKTLEINLRLSEVNKIQKSLKTLNNASPLSFDKPDFGFTEISVDLKEGVKLLIYNDIIILIENNIKEIILDKKKILSKYILEICASYNYALINRYYDIAMAYTESLNQPNTFYKKQISN